MFSKGLPTFPPDLYYVVCYDENGREKKFSCPKIAVTLCGDTLVRHFENAMNVEKPLVIKDFDAKTVTDFFFFVEHRVFHIIWQLWLNTKYKIAFKKDIKASNFILGKIFSSNQLHNL